MALPILTLVAQALGIGGSYVEKRMELTKAKLDAEIKVTQAKAEAEIAQAARAQQSEIDWDLTVARQMESTWKDEWFVILFSIPLVLAFIPFEWADKAVDRGFQNLEQMPDWYAYALGLAVAASFGYRKFVDFMRRK